MAPVKSSRASTCPAPAHRSRGRSPIVAGVAWAPGAGISRVEVQIDDGPWADAMLADAIGASTWRQWAFPWDATAGRHLLRVRATDGNGTVQTAAIRDPFPNAATGYHQITVEAN